MVKKFDVTVKVFGWLQSLLDPCVYLLRDKENNSKGALCVRADDDLTGGEGGEKEYGSAYLKQNPVTFDIEGDQSKLYFLRDKENNFKGVLCVHVDDVLTEGKGVFYDKTIDELRKAFPFRKGQNGEGEYCGAYLRQNPATFDIEVDQSVFAKNLTPVQVRRGAKDEDLANPDEIKELRGLMGKGGWLSQQSRIDLCV